MIALERAQIPVERYVAYEIDENVVNISHRHYSMIEHRGDVQSADFSEFNGFDLLIGGSPCTYWSTARSPLSGHKRENSPSGKGWDLFLCYVKALQQVKPRYFLYENNASINKDIKNKISSILGVDYVVIDSSLVSAQHRKRCYWTNIPFKDIEDQKILLPDILETDPEKLKPFKLNDTPSRRRMWNNGAGYGNGDKRANCDNITYKDKSWTITGFQDRAPNAGLIEFDGFCRMLTFTEQERLQTLPDGYTEGLTKRARGQAIGNGWTVDVIKNIFEGIKSSTTYSGLAQ